MKIFDRDQDETVESGSAAAGEATEAVKAQQDVRMPSYKPTGKTAPQPQATTDRSNMSVIGKTVFVKGELEAAEDMLVEGRLEGSIKHTANRLTVGVSGVVNADIDAKNLVIEGTVDGNIVGSESVVIRESAEVRGNIYTARICIADGAQFSGTVDMDAARSPKH
jgi:cytoskeletal protein CcmA (bactofilin family)